MNKDQVQTISRHRSGAVHSYNNRGLRQKKTEGVLELLEKFLQRNFGSENPARNANVEERVIHRVFVCGKSRNFSAIKKITNIPRSVIAKVPKELSLYVIFFLFVYFLLYKRMNIRATHLCFNFCL